MRDCKATRVEIEEASGALPLGGAAREHVAACAACKEFYAECASLRRLVGELERVSAPDDFDRRLRARMASAGASKRNGRPALFRLAFVPVAAAACLLVGAAGSLYVWQQRKMTPAVATQAGGEGGRARPVQVAESREGEGAAASAARNDESGADSNDAAPANADNTSGRGQKTVR
ncbi:MAG TPA: hypothetical protein VD968_04335, partial [Pyrinomonadaceae bacterium]|nr:hypothetical protein [Pyrinomonadaceae bacterium]